LARAASHPNDSELRWCERNAGIAANSEELRLPILFQLRLADDETNTLD
jgi:hypothetical protein